VSPINALGRTLRRTLCFLDRCLQAKGVGNERQFPDGQYGCAEVPAWRAEVAAWPAALAEAWEERAAIREYDGEFARYDAELLAFDDITRALVEGRMVRTKGGLYG
jgi:hypothetical protein